MDNYEFCTQWIIDQPNNKKARVLDYGCGAGEIVRELRRRNVDAFGCDIFYEGGDYSKKISPQLFDQGVVKKMEGNAIPFPDEFFDFIVNNQVMEHVEHLDNVLCEIDRVLKPGGQILSLFPDKSVWREGHCGIPFIHWFSERSCLRLYYAAALRSLGLGYHKSGKSILRWSREFCEWLDKWTFYRTQEEVISSYSKYFTDFQYIEVHWLQEKIKKRGAMIAWMPPTIQRLLVRKLAGMIFVVRKN